MLTDAKQKITGHFATQLLLMLSVVVYLAESIYDL
jgi:hypothetical protein